MALKIGPCPKCGNTTFIATAHVTQTWLVDEDGPVRYGQDLRCFQARNRTGTEPESSREGDFLQENLLGFDKKVKGACL